MAYDIHVGKVLEDSKQYMGINETIHGSLFRYIKGSNLNLPAISKFSRYYDDAYLGTSNIHLLLNEINRLIALSQNSKDLIDMLEELESVAKMALETDQYIFGVCD